MYSSFIDRIDEINRIKKHCPWYLRKECFQTLFRDCIFHDRQGNPDGWMQNMPSTLFGEKTTRSIHNTLVSHWHGIIQIIAWTVWVVITLCIIYYGGNKLEAYDIVFLSISLLAVTIAVTYSNAYCSRPETYSHAIAKQGEHLRSCWLHANFSWQIASIWLTVSTIYSSGVVVYLSQSSTDLSAIKNRIILYSVLSLLSSFANTSIQT